MKKICSIVLVLALCVGLCAPAFAQRGEEYKSSVLRGMELNSADMTKNSTSRINAAAILLFELIRLADDGNDIVDAISYRGTGYIAKYGSCVDVYYPTSGTKYENLFFMTTSGTVKDYGITTYTGSKDYYYYSFEMSDVWSVIFELVDRLKET